MQMLLDTAALAMALAMVAVEVPAQSVAGAAGVTLAVAAITAIAQASAGAAMDHSSRWHGAACAYLIWFALVVGGCASGAVRK